MHSGSVQDADQWLHDHLSRYVRWAHSHNSLLIVTWDEDSSSYTINCANGVITTTPPGNQIATIFVGEPVVRGAKSTTTYTHQNLLRTVLDMYGATPFGGAATATDINDIWK